MKKSVYLSLILSISIGIVANSCKHHPPGSGGEKNISHNNSDESHNMGQNCMNCHNGNTDAEGCFNAAGTVYDSLNSTAIENGIVKLYTGINASGVLKASIEIDAKGNFHTTENINFSGGLYPIVTSNSGTSKHMNSAITNGACNSCHGVTTSRIWVN